MVLFALSNFLGPLLLGRLFDTVGRVPMIAGTYLGSAAVVAALAVLLTSDALTRWSFMALVLGTFFLASAGASSAYLTVSEIFPLETRALAIALFYAIGTAVGGISGPLLFGQFIHSGDVGQVAIGFFIGAAAMALGAVAELLLGVRAEQQSLEDIAAPLSAEEADGGPPLTGPPDAARDARIRQRADRRASREGAGLRRVRPGPGTSFYSPGMIGTAGTASRYSALADRELDREIGRVVAAVEARGELSERELRLVVAGEGWGPGRLRAATRAALDEGRIVRLPERRVGAAARR